MAAINAKKLKNLIKALTKQLGRIPTFEEIRKAMGGL